MDNWSRSWQSEHSSKTARSAPLSAKTLSEVEEGLLGNRRLNQGGNA